MTFRSSVRQSPPTPTGRNGRRQVRTQVVRGDWGRLSPPAVGAWTPSETVSVVVAAYNCQGLLDLALAALSQQTYPGDLLEVIVVDDGSQPPLRLPEIRPGRCRLVRVSGGWGIANAVNTGVARATGAIVHRLDADMVVFPEHVEALARWHQEIPDAVTLGYKRFVERGTSTPEEVSRRCADGTIGELFADSLPHDYIERLIDTTDQLRAGDHLNFLAHVGATVAMRRDFYLATGGLDPSLPLAEDTEFGFRLAQAGAVFIPEPGARGWHIGPSSMMRRGPQLRRHNHPHLADLMPQPRWLRRGAGRIWRVPLVTAVVTGAGSFECIRTCVDRLLASTEHDLRVVLIGPWDSLVDERRDVLADPLLDERLVAATYRSEPRVRLATQAPETVFPSPYRLDVHPAPWASGPTPSSGSSWRPMRRGPASFWPAHSPCGAPPRSPGRSATARQDSPLWMRSRPGTGSATWPYQKWSTWSRCGRTSSPHRRGWEIRGRAPRSWPARVPCCGLLAWWRATPSLATWAAPVRRVGDRRFRQ